MTHVMACIDSSPSSPAVSDYAAWASQRLNAPLTLLHVLDQENTRRQPISAATSAWVAESICWRSWPHWMPGVQSSPWSMASTCLKWPKSG